METVRSRVARERRADSKAHRPSVVIEGRADRPGFARQAVHVAGTLRNRGIRGPHAGILARRRRGRRNPGWGLAASAATDESATAGRPRRHRAVVVAVVARPARVRGLRVASEEELVADLAAGAIRVADALRVRRRCAAVARASLSRARAVAVDLAPTRVPLERWDARVAPRRAANPAAPRAVRIPRAQTARTAIGDHRRCHTCRAEQDDRQRLTCPQNAVGHRLSRSSPTTDLHPPGNRRGAPRVEVRAHVPAVAALDRATKLARAAARRSAAAHSRRAAASIQETRRLDALPVVADLPGRTEPTLDGRDEVCTPTAVPGVVGQIGADRTTARLVGIRTVTPRLDHRGPAPTTALVSGRGDATDPDAHVRGAAGLSANVAFMAKGRGENAAAKAEGVAGAASASGAR